MKVVIGGRRAGKTHAILEAMRIDPRIYMICYSQRAVDCLRKENPDLATRLLEPHREALQGLDHNTNFIVDNAELLLAKLLGVPIVGVTMTAEAYKLPFNPFLELI